MKLHELAKKNFGGVLTPIMEKREKGNLKDLDGKTITLIDIDVCEMVNKRGEKEQVPVLVFHEYCDLFFFGGVAFRDFATDICCDADAMNELHDTGVKITLKRVTTKQGNTYTKVVFD